MLWTICGLFIVPLTLLLQIFAVGHMCFYKLKFRYVDNRVHPIELSQINAENGPGENENNQHASNLQINTKSYNDILFNMGTIITLLSVFIFCCVLVYSLKTISKENARFVYYVNDFIPLFVTNFVLPCIFLITYHPSRTFLKQLILCK